MAMDETQVVIEIPQAAYDTGERALVDGADTHGTVTSDCVGVVADVLHSAVPAIVAAELVKLADQLTELAEHTRAGKGDQPERRPDRFARAAGLVEGITVIRERAARLAGQA